MGRAQDAADRFEASWNSLRSIELETQTNQEFKDLKSIGRDDPVTSYRISYIETAMGQRYFDRLADSGKKGETLHAAGYSTGERSADVAYDREDPARQYQIIIKSAFMGEGRSAWTFRPVPLKFHHVGSIPFGEAVLKSVHVGETKIAGRTCDQFLMRGVRWKTFDFVFVHHVDRETGTPLGADVFRSEAERAANRPFSTWRASAVDTIDGHLIATSSQERSFSHNPTTEPSSEPLAIVNHEVKRVLFNRDYKSTTFWPAIQPGTNVFDQFAKQHYVSPGLTSRSDTSTTIAKSVANPLRVDASDPYTINPSFVVPIAVVLAILVLVIIWKRRT